MGKYVRKIVDDYCVIDLETTGLSIEFCDIIEIGILKVRKGNIVDKFQSLVRPSDPIDEFIEELTGITNDMLNDAPSFDSIKKIVTSFIGDDLIVGHNVSFDIGFIEKAMCERLGSDYADTMHLSRKIYPDLPHHRLRDMAEFLNLSSSKHRAISDCVSTYELYESIKRKLTDENINLSSLYYKKKSARSILSSMAAENTDLFDEENVFFEKSCCFTGTLDKMTRREAAQIVLNIGGYVEASVTKKTNYLIMGVTDFEKTKNHGLSKKALKAYKLKTQGQDIDIIDENTFYKFIGIQEEKTQNDH